MNETDGYRLKLPNLSDSFVLMNNNDLVLVLPVMLHSVGVLLQVSFSSILTNLTLSYDMLSAWCSTT